MKFDQKSLHCKDIHYARTGYTKKECANQAQHHKSAFAGRNVLLVDDSILRGTASKEIIQMAREAGAKKVYITSPAPPIRYPNIYGIDIPTRHELVAYERDESQIAKEIGCDWILSRSRQIQITSYQVRVNNVIHLAGTVPTINHK